MNDLIRLLKYVVHCLLLMDNLPKEQKIILTQLSDLIDGTKDYRICSICTGKSRGPNMKSILWKKRFADMRERIALRFIYPDGNWEVIVGKTEIEKATGHSFSYVCDVTKPYRVKHKKNKIRTKTTGEIWYVERP